MLGERASGTSPATTGMCCEILPTKEEASNMQVSKHEYLHCPDNNAEVKSLFA